MTCLSRTQPAIPESGGARSEPRPVPAVGASVFVCPPGPICIACEEGDHGHDYILAVMQCACACHHARQQQRCEP